MPLSILSLLLDSLRTKFSTSKAGSLRSRLQDHGPQHDGASISEGAFILSIIGSKEVY